MRFLREILEKKGIHRTLQSYVQLRYLAFCDGDQFHASELKVLIQSRDISLISGYAIERFGKDRVEFAELCVLKQRLNPRPQNYGGAGDRGILIGADDAPSLPDGLIAANGELVVNRGLTLHIGRVSGVKHSAGQDASPVVGAGLVRKAACQGFSVRMFNPMPSLALRVTRMRLLDAAVAATSEAITE